MYKKIATLDGEYKGFKNPSDKTVISLFNKDLKINNLNHVVEDLDTIKKSVKVAKNPRWKWITKNKVYVNMEHTYTRKEYNGATHKTKYIQKCSFLRKNVNSPFYRVYDCENWKKIVVKKYSDNEAKNLKTNGQRADENAANLKMKSLGDIKIPNFQDFKSAALWFHEKLRTSSKKEFEGILYKSLVNDYFVRPGEVKKWYLSI